MEEKRINILLAISLLISVLIGYGKFGLGSVLSACASFDAGLLTGLQVLWTTISCVLIAPIITGLIFLILIVALIVIREIWKNG